MTTNNSTALSRTLAATRRLGSRRAAYGLLLLSLLLGLGQPLQGVEGTVQFSDGRISSGTIELTQPLQIHDGTTLRSVAIDQVAAIELTPASEAMVQGWRFVQPGQPRKEPVGDPYPVRHLTATVVTTGGDRVTGHLTTTLAYLTPTDTPEGSEAEPERERILLPAKQEGQPGQTLTDLVYAVRIAIGTPAGGQARLHLPVVLAPAAQVVLITSGSLARIEPIRTDGDYRLPAPVPAPGVVCWRADDGIHVAWPAPGEAAQVHLAEEAVATALDFLDHRQVLGVWSAAPDQLYALVMCLRLGPTTMPGADKPWRLEVWRWKRAGDRLLWAGRAYAYRGLAANVQALPRVHLEASWWEQSVVDGTLRVGEAGHGP